MAKAWVAYDLFPVFRGGLQGHVLDSFDLFFGQLSANFPGKIRHETLKGSHIKPYALLLCIIIEAQIRFPHMGLSQGRFRRIESDFEVGNNKLLGTEAKHWKNQI